MKAMAVAWSAIGAKHAKPGAVVDGRVTVVALLAALLAEWLEELHVYLQLVTGPLFVRAPPPSNAALVALGAGKSVRAGSVQDPPDTGGANPDLGVPLQVRRDLASPKVVR